MTHRERDTDVVVVADTTAVRGQRDSLDVTAEAVVTLTHVFTAQGDRVAVHDTRGRLRVVPFWTGRRQALRVASALAASNLWARGERVEGVPCRPGSLAIVCSPLLAASTLHLLGELRSRGCRVVVVDTLPSGVVAVLRDADAPWETVTAARLRLASRDQEAAAIRRLGIPVIPWRGTDTVRVVTRAMRGHP